METNAPQMTPEMYAELGGQGAGVPPVEQPTQAPVQTPEAQAPAPDDIEQAKELLGIGGTNDAVSAMQEQLKSMQSDKVQETMTAKYPDIPFELVQKEIAKVEAINPQFAEAMRTTNDGMDMAYRATQASIKPQVQPDNLTHGESGGGQGEDLEEMVVKGKANDFDLGEYIINN